MWGLGMINSETIVSYLQATMPDAAVSITDRTGTGDHFSIRVVSAAFQDKNLLDRNRLIYQSLSEPMADGRIHAMELKAQTPQEAGG
jgi:stress-induced morphogen